MGARKREHPPGAALVWAGNREPLNPARAFVLSCSHATLTTLAGRVVDCGKCDRALGSVGVQNLRRPERRHVTRSLGSRSEPEPANPQPVRPSALSGQVDR